MTAWWSSQTTLSGKHINSVGTVTIPGSGFPAFDPNKDDNTGTDGDLSNTVTAASYSSLAKDLAQNAGASGSSTSIPSTGSGSGNGFNKGQGFTLGSAIFYYGG